MKRISRREFDESQNLGSAENGLSSVHTPYDDLFPSVREPSAQYYLDAMRIYLGLFSGTLSMEDAQIMMEVLKKNPEYKRFPTSPIRLPLQESYKDKILDNLKTLTKFNLLTTDSIRSAYSFTFLMDIVPLAEQDYEVMTYISQNPIESVKKIASDLGLATRTITRTVDKIRVNHRLRFNSLMDYSVFGLQTVLVFFTPRSDIEWSPVEDALYSYPLTKAMLRTTMTDLGYLSIVLPSTESTLSELNDSIDQLSKTIFSYTSVHFQAGIGTTMNLSLYRSGEWEYPEDLDWTLEAKPMVEPRILWNKGFTPGFTDVDFMVGSQLKVGNRSTPRKISQALQAQGHEIQSKKVSLSIKKLNKFNILSPYISIDGVGLSANFCFEIICNDAWKRKILQILPLLPITIFNLTSRGIIIWIQVPSIHQVDYYKFFRSCEEFDGVHSVLPIMTIMQKGSRSVSELVQYWKFRDDRWVMKPDVLNLSDHIASAL
ncbi:MAG: hypothetical protein ACTSUO_00345 [Candidatus Thorarchaeota archaeon]